MPLHCTYTGMYITCAYTHIVQVVVRLWESCTRCTDNCHFSRSLTLSCSLLWAYPPSLPSHHLDILCYEMWVFQIWVAKQQTTNALHIHTHTRVRTLLRQVKACKRENLYKLKVNDIHCRFGAGRVVNHVTGNSPEQKNLLRYGRWCGFFYW